MYVCTSKLYLKNTSKTSKFGFYFSVVESLLIRSFLSVYIKCVCLPYILIVIVLYDTYMQYDIKLHINVMWGGRQVFVYSN